MDQLINTLLISRDPPTFHEVKELAKIYADSSDFLFFNEEACRQIGAEDQPGILIHEHTALLWSRERPAVSLTLNDGKPDFHEYRKWHCLLLDLSEIPDWMKNGKIDINALETGCFICAYDSWHRALYDALLLSASQAKKNIPSTA